MTENSSLTWAAHVRILCLKYNLPDPLTLLDSPLWPKQRWKTHIQTAIITHHEKALRRRALTNSKLTFLNVQMTGLYGGCHPTLFVVYTTQDVTRLRPHLKMLAGDYLCFATLSKERGTDTVYRLCQVDSPAATENIIHLLRLCRGTADTRQRLFADLLNTVLWYFPDNQILQQQDHQTLTQFILDCSSPNLSNLTRINPCHPDIAQIVRSGREFCFAIHKEVSQTMEDPF